MFVRSEEYTGVGYQACIFGSASELVNVFGRCRKSEDRALVLRMSWCDEVKHQGSCRNQQPKLRVTASHFVP